MTITYALEPNLSVSAFKQVLISSGLAERRPMDDEARLEKMLANADVIVVARDEAGTPIGVARSISDHAYFLYCSDLAVASDHKGKGIGKRLLAETAAAVPEVKTCLLTSAPGAVSFYEQAGYERLADTFAFHRNS